MCTNYIPTRGDRLQQFFDVTDAGRTWRDEAYPGYMAPMIRSAQIDGPAGGQMPVCEAACFGLIPGWSRDGLNFRHCYNSRTETVAQKPSFRNAWRKRQFCLVPVDAFFEPNYESGRPVRWRIERSDGEPMALAGIWEAWRRPPAESTGRSPGPTDAQVDEHGWLLSFALLTINADQHPVMRRFHPPDDEKRSVVVIPSADRLDWLDGGGQDPTRFWSGPDPDEMRIVADPRPVAARKAPSIPRARPRQAG